MSGFIAIEGLDGSGKSTQIELLIKYLHENDIQTKFIHFPRVHEGIFGDLISKFLRGEFGDVASVHPLLVALLFAEDRKEFSVTINDWLNNDYFVLVDRYVLSNIAFQCAKLTDENERKYLRDWINNLEYNHYKIPKPDFSIYLDVPFEFVTTALEERRKKKERAYLNDKDDIHENDYSLQKRVKEQYDTLCKVDDTIHRINCADGDNKMRSIQSIHQEIVDMINVKIS